MAELGDLAIRWQRGWCAARSLPTGEDVGGAIRAHCRQRGREVEYLALPGAGLERLAKLVLAEEERRVGAQRRQFKSICSLPRRVLAGRKTFLKFLKKR